MDLTTNERLAAMEAKLEILKELLKEIRDDVKNSPTRSEFDDLKEEVQTLKDKQMGYMIKVGSVAGTLGILSGLIAQYFLKFIGH